jgi:hypothetical protein
MTRDEGCCSIVVRFLASDEPFPAYLTALPIGQGADVWPEPLE